MNPCRHREETLNTQLAILLSRFGVQADAETVQFKDREQPDVLFIERDLRVIIKGKFTHRLEARQLALSRPWLGDCGDPAARLSSRSHQKDCD
jgi:hypothetical protein